jgi:ubiquinone/menaquinone biosynthesis C-methylase UbiE
MPSRTPTQPSPDSAESKEYILGTGEQEVDRLGLQHRLWSASAHLLWEQAGLRPGMSVLDVGSGPGHATMDLAEIVTESGSVLAVDESPLFLHNLHERVQGRRRRNVQRILGDIQQLPSLAPELLATIDFAYARWVLCFVRDPEAVVAGVAAMLKRGGRFVIQDYFAYETMTLAPKSEPFSRVIRAVGQSWRDRGGDPDVAGRLPALLRNHGFEVSHLAVNQRVATPGSTIWAWPDAFWKNYLPRLMEMGYITREEREAFEATWAEASADPDGFMMLPPLWDIVAEKQ